MSILDITCGDCNRRILKKKAKKLKCCICSLFFHKKCTSISNSSYWKFDSEKNYICNKCIADNIPFSKVSNENLSLINTNCKSTFSYSENVASPTVKSHAFFEKCNNMSFLLNNQDQSLNIRSEYLSIDKLNKLDLNTKSCFNVAHLNIASLNKHVDDLQI